MADFINILYACSLQEGRGKYYGTLTLVQTIKVRTFQRKSLEGVILFIIIGNVH